MKKEMTDYVTKCGICQQVKVEHWKPVGLLQLLSIPEWKWEMITMDFVLGLPRGKKGNYAIGVIMDRLTKSSLFIPVKMTDSVNKLTKICVNKVEALWSSSINCFRQKPKVYFMSLAKHIMCLGNTIEYQHYLPSVDWWLIWESYLDPRGFTKGTCFEI